MTTAIKLPVRVEAGEVHLWELYGADGDYIVGSEDRGHLNAIAAALNASRPAVVTEPVGEIARFFAARCLDKNLTFIEDQIAQAIERARLTEPAQGWVAFQPRVQPWMLECFGAEISRDIFERCHRFLEESLELVQAGGTSASEAHQLVDYVYGRPVGELHQEVGGVMVTLAALCLAFGSDMHECGEVELARVWKKIDVIRAKQAAKPKHSPLPAPAQDKAQGECARCRDSKRVLIPGSISALDKFIDCPDCTGQRAPASGGGT